MPSAPAAPQRTPRGSGRRVRASGLRTRARAAPAGTAQGAGSVAAELADAPSQTLRRTPLYDRHVAASARLVPFAGWEMPVQYEGIREEHVAVRTQAGALHVSHKGPVETSGAGARGLPSGRGGHPNAPPARRAA